VYRLLIASILVLTSSITLAVGNVENGETLIAPCAVCHGTDGISPAGSFPSIAGQGSKYLLKQLKEIKSGERPAVLMTGVLDDLSDQEMEDIAAYYASKDRQKGASDAELVALGESVYRSGIKRKSVAACTSCHLPSGEGNNQASFPALAGQWPEYTVTQLKAFRQGMRANDEGGMMRKTAMDLSDDEIEAVANYLYGLK
jgi:cytochrome c553